jgi:hypothetical protein
VFDEAARLAGRLHGIVGTPNDYVWSAGNSAEVEAGWIVRGDSPAELAAAIGLDPGVLAATLGEYAGVPIPGLYAAGGAGPIWGHLTEHGGGLTDAVVFGRLAGAEAARTGHGEDPGP